MRPRPSQLSASVGQTLEGTLRPRVLLAALGLATVACGRHDAPPDVIERAGGAELLRESALALRALGSQANGQVVVPRGRWPEAFRRLEPEVVTVDGIGVDVTLNIDTFYSSGLYLPFDPSRKPKDLGHDLSYRSLAPGIYWYRMLMGG